MSLGGRHSKTKHTSHPASLCSYRTCISTPVAPTGKSPCGPINPCGGGRCAASKDGKTNTCSCPDGFVATKNDDGSQTCSPGTTSQADGTHCDAISASKMLPRSYSLTYSLTHSLNHSLTYPISHSSLARSLVRTLAHSHTHKVTHFHLPVPSYTPYKNLSFQNLDPSTPVL